MEKPARSVTIVMPQEQPMSLNHLFARLHWAKRNAEVSRVKQMVRAYLDPDWPMFDGEVDIQVRAYFKNKRVQLDSDNIPCKLYVDGLKGWLIPDDSREYVRGVLPVSEIDRENPRVEINVTEVSEWKRQ